MKCIKDYEHKNRDVCMGVGNYIVGILQNPTNHTSLVNWNNLFSPGSHEAVFALLEDFIRTPGAVKSSHAHLH